MSDKPSSPTTARPKGSIGASTAVKGFAFSWFSVCVAETVTIPIDTVKVRMQLQGELGAVRQYSSAFDAFGKIARTEGVLGLWKGLAPAVLRQSLYGTFRYGSYEPIKQKIGVGSTGDCPIWKKILAACIAGTAGSFIAVPCDLVKVRMQADVAGTRYASTFAAFCEIMRAEGLRGMWRGAGPTCTRAAVGAMTELPVYDEIKTRLLDHNVLEDGFQVHTASALCAGLFSTFWMNPFDVAKSRIMNQVVTSGTTTTTPQYRGMVDCMVKTVSREGVASLWKGFWPAYTRIGPRVLIIFVVLEQLRSRFDN